MNKLHLVRAAAIGAMLSASAVAPASAASMPAACTMLPLADVRAIVGAPVTVFHDQQPVAIKGGGETTNCLYMVSLKGELSASVWLERATPDHILAMHRAYAGMKGRGVDGVRGNTIVVVNVAVRAGSGVAMRDDISKKLLAAVLGKV